MLVDEQAGVDQFVQQVDEFSNVHDTFGQLFVVDGHVQKKVFEHEKKVAEPDQQVVVFFTQFVAFTQKLNQLKFGDPPAFPDLTFKHFPQDSDRRQVLQRLMIVNYELFEKLEFVVGVGGHSYLNETLVVVNGFFVGRVYCQLVQLLPR